MCAGVSDAVTDLLRSKVENMPENSRICTICMDEMSHQDNLAYDPNTDQVIGLEDLGNGQKSQPIANSEMVFMARGLVDNWKQPLVCYLVTDSWKSDVVKEKLLDVIDKISTHGCSIWSWF